MKDTTLENSWFTDFKEFQESVDKPAKDSTNEFFNRHQYASFEAVWMQSNLHCMNMALCYCNQTIVMNLAITLRQSLFTKLVTN